MRLKLLDSAFPRFRSVFLNFNQTKFYSYMVAPLDGQIGIKNKTLY